MYRDKNFDVKELFGIEINEQLPEKKVMDSPERGNIGSNNSYLIKNRVK
jgi:hypothetical protein